MPKVGGGDATPFHLAGPPSFSFGRFLPSGPSATRLMTEVVGRMGRGLHVEGHESGPVAPEWPVLLPRGCEGPGGPWWACPFVGMAEPLSGALGFDGFLTPRRIQKHV